MVSVRRLWSAGIFTLSIAVVGAPAQAHHSFAQFDMKKTVSLTGTIRTLEWTNPHVWVWLTVPGPSGSVATWGFETAAPGEMARQGWSRTALQPGDKVTITAHPLRDGRTGGSLAGKVVFADGHTLGTAPVNAKPPSGPPTP